jgi:hypothetical protein
MAIIKDCGRIKTRFNSKWFFVNTKRIIYRSDGRLSVHLDNGFATFMFGDIRMVFFKFLGLEIGLKI